jgi:hypothetical protein
MRRRLLPFVLALVLVNRSLALINPNFTPANLVQQSDQILEVTFSGAKDGGATAAVKTALKGKDAPKTVVFNLKASALKEHAIEVEKVINAMGATPTLFFLGRMETGEGQPGMEAPAEEAAEKGMLHLGTRWVAFDKGKDGSWELGGISSHMLGTWNGDTPMLRAAVLYILADPAADLPCVEGVNWGTPAAIAKVAGRVTACQPVALTDAGEPALLVASDAGTRLFQWDAKAAKFQDLTAARKLNARSRAAAWGDFNADGRFDLASADGEAVTVFLQAADGTFAAGPALAALSGAEVVSLAPLDAGKPALLIGTTAQPLLWTPGEANAAAKPIGAAPAGAAGRGANGRCLVADFDNDGLPDVLQTGVKASLFHKGTAPGKFAPAAACAVALGPGPADAFAGDFDEDGLLDVFTAGDYVCLWNNRGDRFLETLMASGELSYRGNVNACGGAAGDFNGDGLRDVVFFYPGEVPNINFNRGFRSFGHANKIDFQTSGVLPGVENGQQAGCWGDLDDDGVCDLTIVLKDGTVWFLPFDNGGERGRCARVALAGKGGRAGPVSVSAWRGKRPFGAWSVSAGTPVMISQPEAGPVTLKWRLPGGPLQTKDLVIENAPVSFTLP